MIHSIHSFNSFNDSFNSFNDSFNSFNSFTQLITKIYSLLSEIMYSCDSMSRKYDRIPKFGLPIVTSASVRSRGSSHSPFEWYVQFLFRYSRLRSSPRINAYKCASAWLSWHRWKKLHCS